MRGARKRKRAVRLGDLQRVENLNAYPSAARKYNHIRVQFPDGDERSLLFTDHEICQAMYRAERNPEDLPRVGWLRDLID